MFAPPPVIETEIFARLPDEHRISELTDWARLRGGGALHSFLEGPSFDRAGNLYCVDLVHGRIFRIAPDGGWTKFAHYKGRPNGLKIHKDGRIFVADAENGILWFDPVTGARHTFLDSFEGKKLNGPNDLFFADNGDLYFTDPGESSLEYPVGRVFRVAAADGKAEVMVAGLAYPNGVLLSHEQDLIFFTETRTNTVKRSMMALSVIGTRRTGVFFQLSGSLAGPDGMAQDENLGLVVAHAGLGTVWHFDIWGNPVARIKSCAGIRTSNVAFGGPDGRSLYITEAQDGVILRARLPVAGRKMYAHQ